MGEYKFAFCQNHVAHHVAILIFDFEAYFEVMSLWMAMDHRWCSEETSEGVNLGDGSLKGKLLHG